MTLDPYIPHPCSNTSRMSLACMTDLLCHPHNTTSIHSVALHGMAASSTADTVLLLVQACTVHVPGRWQRGQLRGIRQQSCRAGALGAAQAPLPSRCHGPSGCRWGAPVPPADPPAASLAPQQHDHAPACSCQPLRSAMGIRTCAELMTEMCRIFRHNLVCQYAAHFESLALHMKYVLQCAVRHHKHDT